MSGLCKENVKKTKLFLVTKSTDIKTMKALKNWT